MRRVLDFLIGRTGLPFADPVPAARSGCSFLVSVPPAEPVREGPGSVGGLVPGALAASEPSAPAYPSSGAPTADLRHGRHANDCLFLDDPKHVCEDWHGNTTSRMCRASVYHREAVDFEARHPHLTPRAPVCRFTDDPWHRCVNESGQPSTTVCHATQTRRIPTTPQEVAS